MAKKYIARHAGQEFKRGSQNRVYAYCVVARDDYEQELSRVSAKGSYPHDAKNFEFCRAMAEQGQYLSRDMLLKVKSEEERAKYRASLKGCSSAAEYVAKCRAERMAWLQDKVAKGGFEVYHSLGWCSRLDLAQKLAAKSRFSVILEAKEV